jgi:hypothetical protein
MQGKRKLICKAFGRHLPTLFTADIFAATQNEAVTTLPHRSVLVDSLDPFQGFRQKQI